MKRLLAPILLILGLACGLAFAQNITKGIQLSQDNTGPIGMDAANNAYFPNKINVTRTVPPVISACGTGTAITGNDTVGKFTSGNTTACVITFSSAYNVAPACILAPQGNLNYPTYTTSTTAITITVDVAATVYNYICMSQG